MSLRSGIRPNPDEQSQPSIRQVDVIADRYVDECVARYPEIATFLGIRDHDDSWSDYSPSGLADRVAHIRSTIAALHAAAPRDERENTAKGSHAGAAEPGSRVVRRPHHSLTGERDRRSSTRIRAIFDLMPTDSEDAWRNIAARLRSVHRPLGEVRETLER